MALPQLPYSLEQLEQMQAAAAAIVASKEEIQQCSAVLRKFSMTKCTQYIELREQELVLREKEFDTDSKRFPACTALGPRQDSARGLHGEDALFQL